MYVTVVYYTPTAFNVQGPTNVRIPPDNPGRVTATSLAQAGRENKLQFDVVSTDKQARFLVVGCKKFHWNPPAGILSRTRQLFAQASRAALL